MDNINEIEEKLARSKDIRQSLIDGENLTDIETYFMIDKHIYDLEQQREKLINP